MDEIALHASARGHRVHGRSAAHDPALRLNAVLLASGLNPLRRPVGVESHSNDTYLIGDPVHGPSVLRICYRGDVGRLLREAAVGGRVPPEVGYPDVLGSGETFVEGWRLTWSLTRQLRGSTLRDAWPGLTSEERRQATRSAGDALRALHAWRPERGLVADLEWPSPDTLTTPDLVIGASLHPLPMERAGVLIDALATRGDVDQVLVGAARDAVERLGHLAPELDDPAPGQLIHGDLHLSNIWWSDRGEAGLIDLEWVRFAPPWVDLARIQENADADLAEGVTAHVDFLRWLEEDSPQLFAVDRFADRIRLCCLVFQVRQALIWGPVTSSTGIAPDHPLRMLERLV